MGLWQDLRNYLRTGVPARTLDERALVKYSSYEVLAPEWSMVDAETMARDGHRKNALAYACIEYVARAVATPVLEAVRETSDGYEELPPLDPLTRLLERPSEDYPSQTRFFRQVVRNLMLTGECILYKVPGDRTGRVVELQMLPSNKVSVERKANGEKTYLYYYDPSLPPKRLRSDEVLFIKFDDVLNKDRGLAPLAAAARETDVDNATADIRKSFFEHGAILEGILTTEQQANEKQLKEWSAMWSRKYAGPKNAGKTPALAGGLSYQTVGATPDKWAFKEVTGLTEARICSAFGVPPILVGAKIGLDRSTYANYKEARSAFWEDTATPLLVFLADEFTGGLTELSDGRRCRWNTDEVPALQEDADSREERAGRSLGKGTITINEYREAAGLDPVADGDYYMMPTNIKLVAEGEIEEFAQTSSGATPEQLKPFTGEEPDDGEEEEPEEEPGEGTPEASPPAEEGTRSLDHGVRLRPVRREVRDSHSAEEIGRLERRLARAIEGVFGTQAEAVAEKVGDTLDPDELLDLTVEAERMAEAATPHIRSILQEAGEDAAKEAQDEGFGEGEFDPEGEDAIGYMETAPLLLGYEMARHTRDLVGETIAAVQAANPEGWTTDEIADRLREIIVDRDRANLAAETETVRTSNRAARFAYRQAGVTELEWFTTSPEPCEFCRAMEGRTVSVDEAFAALGDEIEGSEGGVRTVDYEDLWDTLHPRCGCGVRPKT